MKKYLIAYGDDIFKESRERIGREARALGEFDEVIIYTPDDLPQDFKQHPLLKYKKGGGYWVWKAFLTLKTLKEINDGDILFYVDSGSSLYPSKQWKEYFRLLEQKDMIAFKIMMRCGAYTKRRVLDYFSQWLGPYWGHYYQVAATTFCMKKSDFTVAFAEEWLSLFTEEMCCDASPEELPNQYPDFIEHRWDQSLLCGLVYKYADRIAIRTNDFESRHEGQAIWASRLRDNKPPLAVRTKNWWQLHLKRPAGILWRAVEHHYWESKNRNYLAKHRNS